MPLSRMSLIPVWAIRVERVIFWTIPMSNLISIKAKAIGSITFSIGHEQVGQDNFLPSSFWSLDHVKCIEAYPTLHKVPNRTDGLHYSDHLAVYARFEIDDQVAREKHNKAFDDLTLLDDERRTLLRSACILVEESIQRLRRQRLIWIAALLLFVFLLFFLGRNLWSTGSLLTLVVLVVKDLLCLIGLSICLWFVCLGKQMERNALRAVQNAMHLRLRTSEFVRWLFSSRNLW